jgi:hypothetical protein
MHAFMMMVDLLPGSTTGLDFVGSAIRVLLDQLAVKKRSR